MRSSILIILKLVFLMFIDLRSGLLTGLIVREIVFVSFGWTYKLSIFAANLDGVSCLNVGVGILVILGAGIFCLLDGFSLEGGPDWFLGWLPFLSSFVGNDCLKSSAPDDSRFEEWPRELGISVYPFAREVDANETLSASRSS